MRFLARLRPELICLAPPWTTLAETVGGLIGVMVEAGELATGVDVRARDAILAREAEASTALLEIHAGVPHARLAEVREPLVALAASPAGLYEAVPTVPISIVALVLSPLDATTSHLETLAEVATVLRSDELRAALLGAADARAALDALHAHARAMPGSG